MPAVFDQYYVKRLNGTHVKNGKNKCDLAEQLCADIQNSVNQVDRVVIDLVRIDGDFYGADRRPRHLRGVRERPGRQRPRHRSLADLRLRRPQRRRPLRQRRAQPHGRHALP